MYDSSIETGEITFRVKHSDNDRIDFVAAALISKYNFVTPTESDTILLFTGKIYENKKALAIIKEETEKRIDECTERDRLEVISKIKAKTYKNLEDFDSDPNFINLENGILDLRTMKLKPHTPTYLSKILITCNYKRPQYEIKDETIFEDIEVNLQHTLYWKFLESSFTDVKIVDGKIVYGKVDEENIETVLEINASVFIKKPIDERAFIMWGEGENGKSVLLDYISFMLGKDNISNIPLQELTADKFAAANLDGKHANIFSDLEKNEFQHTSKFRALASGEPVYAQYKNKQGFDLHPFSSLIFSTNRFPKVYGDNKQGFFRRWIIVKWLRNFENDPQRDSKLKEKLLQNTADRDIVFSTLIHISRKLLKSNKFSYSKNWKENQKVWNENADPVKNFIENYTLEVENHSESKRETHNFYKEICDELGETPLGMKQFSLAMSEYYDESKSHGTRTWNHMKLKRPVQESLQDYDDTESKSVGDT
jgi:putative DNA primase/helicase